MPLLLLESRGRSVPRGACSSTAICECYEDSSISVNVEVIKIQQVSIRPANVSAVTTIQADTTDLYRI